MRLRVSPPSIVRAVVIVGVVVGLSAIALRATHPLVNFLEAAVIAALARPVVVRMGRKMPEWVAVMLLTLAVVLAVAGLGASGFSELRSETSRFARRAPAAAEQLERGGGVGHLLRDLKFSKQVGVLSKNVKGAFSFGGSDLPGLASAVGGRVSSAFIVWVLAVMLVFAGPAMVHGALGLMGESRRATATDVVQTAYGVTLRYLGWTSLRCLVAGLVAYVLALALGIGMPSLLAVLVVLCAFTPRVGVMVGFLPLALVGLLNSPGTAVLVLLVGLGVQLVDTLVVQRLIDERSMQVGILVTVVALVLGFSLYGVVGVFVGMTLGCLLVGSVRELGQLQEAGRAGR